MDDVVYPYTHEIAGLLALTLHSWPALEDLSTALTLLTPFAVNGRYPGQVQADEPAAAARPTGATLRGGPDPSGLGSTSQEAQPHRQPGQGVPKRVAEQAGRSAGHPRGGRLRPAHPPEVPRAAWPPAGRRTASAWSRTRRSPGIRARRRS